jgi:hypothetical protein
VIRNFESAGEPASFFDGRHDRDLELQGQETVWVWECMGQHLTSTGGCRV